MARGRFGGGFGSGFGSFGSGFDNNFGNNLRREIEEDHNRIRNEIQQSMEQTRREINASFSDPFFHSEMRVTTSPRPVHVIPSPIHQPSAAEIAAERRREQERAERARVNAERDRLKAERLREEAAANEERRKLEKLKADERRKEEQARLKEEEAERQLEWEKQEAIRKQEEKIRRIEEEKKAEARRLRAAQEAEERRIQAEREAEELRIAHEKMLAEIKRQEDDTENARVAVFDAHQNLILPAANLELIELQSQINSLSPLTKPIQRFENSNKKGMPLAPDGNTTLFFSILLNKKFSNESKIKLFELLLDNKGYAPHINLFFSSPIIEKLIEDAQPKPILPDPVVLLCVLYKRAIQQHMVFSAELQQRIYPPLILNGFGPVILDHYYQSNHYHYAETKKEILQFLNLWKGMLDLNQRPDAVFNFYSFIFNSYKNMQNDLYNLIKADFLATFQNGYSTFTNMIIQCGLSKERISDSLTKWSEHLSAYDVGSFVATYNFLLTIQNPMERFEIDPVILKRILTLDKNAASFLYQNLKQINLSTEKLMHFLQCWTSATDDKEILQQIMNFYLDLSKNSPSISSAEEKVVVELIKNNKKFGFEIFIKLLANDASKTKLLKYFENWMSVLSNDEEIRAAYHQVKSACINSSLSDFRFQLRAIAEIYIENLVAKHSIILNEPETQKWLRYTRPGLFGMSCSNKRSSYDTYQALRVKHSDAQWLFNRDKESAASEINQKLVAAGEEGRFVFKM